jgi:antitoxin MazE
MKVDIIPIGNSKGIRIPKALLDQCGLEGSVELIVKNKQLVLSSTRKPREGWEEAAKAMAAAGDDELIELPAPAFDQEEWEW